MEIKVFEGANPNVKKYVFTKPSAVYEAVVYKYPEYQERTVICCSVMSGCPVGCTFCGTGRRFVRNLDTSEIVEQIINVLEKENILELAKEGNINKFQIMFMSMGEPMLNWDNVELAIKTLNSIFPSAQLLLSTVGIDNGVMGKIIKLAVEIDKVGLQFSLHYGLDNKRNELIPFSNKLTIRQIRDAGVLFYKETGRMPYLNYCVTEDSAKCENVIRMLDLFSPLVFCFTFSTVCKADKSAEDITDYNNLYSIQDTFMQEGYNVRVFDPAGKDDIGGGCGQLWYVQEWLKNYKGE